MRPGKVLLVANTDWYLYNFRLALAGELARQGSEVVLVSPRGKYHEKIQSEGYRWVEWQVGRRTMSPVYELPAILQLNRIYRQERPDLVHHFTVKPVLYGSLAARMSGVPALVNSVTGLGYIFITSGWKGHLLRSVALMLYRIAFSHPNMQVIFENISDMQVFQRLQLTTPQNSHVISGVGVDVARFHPTPDPDAAPPLVVFPARMLMDKGLGTVIDAARILRERVQLRIALVGEPDPGNPATVTEDDLRGWEREVGIEWWGFRDNMADIFRQASIVTLPSYGEGLPTVLIEAAASARPIVASDVPGCRDVVQDGVNGFLVPPKDPAALAHALETLALDRSLRERMGSCGRQIVLDKFTDQQVIQETDAVYQRVLGRMA